MKTQRLRAHLEKLNGFQRVAQLGSFHRAARSAGISQPALSRSIEHLENVLETRLLIRGRAGVQLTADGSRLLTFCQSLDKSLMELDLPQESGSDEVGIITLGTYETLCASFWPPFLRRFYERHPSLRIDLITSDESSHWSRLLSGQLDAIFDAEPELNRQWDSHVIYRDHFGLYVALSLSKRFRSMFSSPGQRIPIVLVERATDENGTTVFQHLVQQNIHFYVAAKLDTFSSVREFTIAGLGIGVLPIQLGEPEVRRKTLEAIDIQGISSKGFGRHRLCLSVSNAKAEDRKIKTLRSELKKYFSE